MPSESADRSDRPQANPSEEGAARKSGWRRFYFLHIQPTWRWVLVHLVPFIAFGLVIGLVVEPEERSVLVLMCAIGSVASAVGMWVLSGVVALYFWAYGKLYKLVTGRDIDWH